MAPNCEKKASISLSKDSNKPSEEKITETPQRYSHRQTRRIMRSGASFAACRNLLTDIIEYEQKEKAHADKISDADAALAVNNIILQAESGNSTISDDNKEEYHLEVEFIDCIVEIDDTQQDATTATNTSNYPILDLDIDPLSISINES